VDWSDEQTDDPLYADKPNFYKVEKCNYGTKVDSLVFFGGAPLTVHRGFI
jgi:hypothetical protein